MKLEQYISLLLFHHRAVIVPGLGGFIAEEYPSVIHTTTNIIHPPKKMINFNNQLDHNDQLLINTVAEKEEISLDVAAIRIKETVDEWSQKIRGKQIIILDKIGKLWIDEEHKIAFRCTANIDYMASSYGLNSVSADKAVKKIIEKESEDDKKDVYVMPPLPPPMPDYIEDDEEYYDHKTNKTNSLLFWVSILLILISAGFIVIQILNIDISTLFDNISSPKDSGTP